MSCFLSRNSITELDFNLLHYTINLLTLTTNEHLYQGKHMATQLSDALMETLRTMVQQEDSKLLSHKSFIGSAFMTIAHEAGSDNDQHGLWNAIYAVVDAAENQQLTDQQIKTFVRAAYASRNSDNKMLSGIYENHGREISQLARNYGVIDSPTAGVTI